MGFDFFIRRVVGIVVQVLVVIGRGLGGYLLFAGELLVAPFLGAALLQGVEFVHCRTGAVGAIGPERCCSVLVLDAQHLSGCKPGTTWVVDP